VESLFTASLHLSDFVQTQNEAKILTESINVVIDDEEIHRPISREENQLDSVDVSAALTDIIKSFPNVSPDEPPSSPTASDTTSCTSEDEDIFANQPKQAWVKHNHPP
jgi:hypothetical protein